MIEDFSKQLQCAKTASVEAGKAIAMFYGQSLKVTHKSANQPLTEADLAANTILKQHLQSEFPDYGWLSEEDVDNETRLDQSLLWVVDPLDGTRDFINHNPEFAVSVALVYNQQPVVGVVYNPITKELFYAAKNSGAFCDGKKISVKQTPNLKESKPELIVSQSEFNRGEWNSYLNEYRVRPTGGCAYKMGKIARGDAEGTFTLNPKSEWDICAGAIIVKEASGVVTDLYGQEIIFNKPSTIMDGLIYCNSTDLLQKILTSIKIHDPHLL